MAAEKTHVVPFFSPTSSLYLPILAKQGLHKNMPLFSVIVFGQNHRHPLLLLEYPGSKSSQSLQHIVGRHCFPQITLSSSLLHKMQLAKYPVRTG